MDRTRSRIFGQNPRTVADSKFLDPHTAGPRAERCFWVAASNVITGTAHAAASSVLLYVSSTCSASWKTHSQMRLMKQSRAVNYTVSIRSILGFAGYIHKEVKK